MAAVAGLRGSGDWGTDERPKSFREGILFRNPNGTAPIFALTSKMDESKVTDPEFSWWDEPNDNIRLLVNGALNNVATTVVVDSGDPDATDAGRDLPWGLATHLKPGDVLMVEKTEVAAIDNELILVTAVASATSFTVSRGFGGTTAASIADNAYLLKVGNAYEEGSAAPNAVSRNPIKYYNYCQIFKTAYELTRSVLKIDARTGDPLQIDKKRKMFDHARDIEWSLLFGRRSETTGSGGKPLRTMGGLRTFIPSTRTTIFGAAITTNTFLDAIYKVFDFDTPAGDQRIAFCGNAALNAINKMAAAAGQIQYTGIVDQYGMKLREYTLPQGTIYLKTHPLFNRHADIYSKSMLILDPASIKIRELRSTFFEDEIQTPGTDTRKGQWITEMGLEVHRGGLTCGYLGNITY